MYLRLALALILGSVAPASGQIIVPAPAPGAVAAGLVTIGDGISSFGTFNGKNQQPFRLALMALPGGGVIEVLPGHYSIDRSVDIDHDDITLRGSAGAKLLATGGGAVGVFRILGDNVRVSGLQFKTNTPAPGQTAILGLGQSIAIDHCTFVALGGAADYRFLEFGDGIASRRGTLIEGNTFLFTANSTGIIGVTLRLGTDLRMNDNEFRRDDGGPGLCRYAVQIESESKGTISGNSFQNLGSGPAPMQAVIYSNADTEGHHFAITGNFFENCLAPQVVQLAGGRFCNITGNVFGRMLAATGGVVRLGPSQNGFVGEANVIGSNQFHNVALGISADESLFTNIHGNQFTICTTPQIQIGPNAHGAVIVANQFVGSASLTADIPTAIIVTTSVDHLIHSNACMSQTQAFHFLSVVTSNSTDADIAGNFNS